MVYGEALSLPEQSFSPAQQTGNLNELNVASDLQQFLGGLRPIKTTTYGSCVPFVRNSLATCDQCFYVIILRRVLTTPIRQPLIRPHMRLTYTLLQLTPPLKL